MEIPAEAHVSILEPERLSLPPSLVEALEAALAWVLQERPTPMSVAIAVADHSRTLPVARLLPVMLAACPEGVGDEEYYRYACRFIDPPRPWRTSSARASAWAPHKCFLFGRTLTRYRVVVHRELDSALLRRCHLTAGDAQKTL